MEKLDLVRIGKVIKSHGIKGEVKCLLDAKDFADIKSLEVLFLNQNEKPLPYFTESIKKKPDDTFVIKWEEVNSPEAAELLRGKDIFIESKKLYKRKAFSPIDLIGFQLIDFETKNETGVIEDVLELPVHALAQLKINNKEVLIPLHDDSIKKVDKKNKKVFVLIPEGLIEVFQ
jgi:16S rRNA processing protein RimM